MDIDILMDPQSNLLETPKEDGTSLTQITKTKELP